MVYNIYKATAMLALAYATCSANASSVTQENKSGIRGSPRRRRLKSGKASRTTPSPTPTATPTETAEIILRVSSLSGRNIDRSKETKAQRYKLSTDDNGCYETTGFTYNLDMMVQAMADPGEFCHTYLNQKGEDHYVKRVILMCRQQDDPSDNGTGCEINFAANKYYGPDHYFRYDDDGVNADAKDIWDDNLFVEPKWIQLYSKEYECSNPDCSGCAEEGAIKIIKYDKGLGENPESKCWFEEPFVCFGHWMSPPIRFLESNNDPGMVDQYYKTLAKNSCLGEYI